MATLAELGIRESPFGGYTDAFGNYLNPTDYTLQSFVYNDGRPYTPATQATGTLQQLIEASRNVNYGGNGDAATVINPFTGQAERADIGFTAPGLDAQSAGSTFFVPQSVAEQWRAGGAPTGVGLVAGGLQSGPWINHSNESNFLDDYGPLLMAGGFGAGHLLTGGALGGLGAEAAGGSFLDSLPGMTQAAAPIVEGGATATSPWVGSASGFGNIAGTGLDLSTPLSASLGASEYLPAAAGSGLDLATPLSVGAVGGAGASLPSWLPSVAGSGVSSVLGGSGASGAAGAAGAAGVGAAGGTAGAGAGAGTAAGGTLSQLLGLTGVAGTAVDAFGRAIPGLLGAYASNQQADQLSELAKENRLAEEARYRDLVARDEARYNTALQREDSAIARQRGDIDYSRAIGAPSRERFEGSFAPGFDISKEAGYSGAMDTTMNTLLRQLSANGGNPFGNPGGLMEAEKYVMGNVALPYLQNYRTQNAGAGGYGSYGAAGANVPGIGSGLPPGTTSGSGVGTGGPGQFDLAALNSGGNVWNSLGASAGNIFNPPSTLEQLLKQLKGAGLGFGSLT